MRIQLNKHPERAPRTRRELLYHLWSVPGLEHVNAFKEGQKWTLQVLAGGKVFHCATHTRRIDSWSFDDWADMAREKLQTVKNSHCSTTRPLAETRSDPVQSILTKYIPESATKPSRIKAWTSGGARSIIRSRHAYDGAEDAHLAVARELAESLGWHGVWVEGSLGDKAGGNVYVCMDDRRFTVEKVRS